MTGATMIVGSVLFVPTAWRDMAAAWSPVPPAAWVAIVGSALLALNGAYLIWYTAVQHLGSSRASIYSNLVPIGAMVVAALTLGERIGDEVAGAAAVVRACC